jgi:hypothetical protein
MLYSSGNNDKEKVCTCLVQMLSQRPKSTRTRVEESNAPVIRAEGRLGSYKVEGVQQSTPTHHFIHMISELGKFTPTYHFLHTDSELGKFKFCSL